MLLVNEQPLSVASAGQSVSHSPEMALSELNAERRIISGAVKVFPTAVTNRTHQRDFERAGIQRVDADGRVVDFHALRTTYGTELALQGVAPQLAQRLMRHGDYRTTLQHYTVLGLADTAVALENLPTIGAPIDEQRRATGTHDAPPPVTTTVGAPKGANQCETTRRSDRHARHATTSKNDPCGSLRGKRANGLEPSTFSLEGCGPEFEATDAPPVTDAPPRDYAQRLHYIVPR